MLVIAHRGSNRKAPENSMEAFEISVEEGAKRIELDLHLSRDEQVYVCHDDSTARTTSKKGLKISNATQNDLNDVRLSNGETLPTLEKTFALLDRVELNLELKGENLNLADVVAKKIKLLDKSAIEKLILSSFNVGMLERLSERCPEVKRAYLWEPELKDRLAIDKNRIIDGLKRSSTHIFHPHAEYFTKELSNFSKFNDLEVYTWAPLRCEEINKNSQLWETLYALDVDGHCTNFPLELGQFLREKEMSRR